MKTITTHTKTWIDKEGVKHSETVEIIEEKEDYGLPEWLPKYPISDQTTFPNWTYPNVNTPSCCVTCANRNAGSCNCTLPYIHGLITYCG